ncbi:hypothetical protein VTN77DRAFT_7911 [Rasamsonia byssochlamydoides]|uniref:uncharacterized protein n=1 Tax=Rasamsonia byssochlamydoides TaxID=89139 RepID=UPI0037443A12
MQEDYLWSSQAPLESIEEDSEGIDIEFTDGESDSDYSWTDSDKAFIVPDEKPLGFEDNSDPNYEPLDTDERITRMSSSNLAYSMNGKEGPDGKVTEYLVKCWVEQQHIDLIVDLLRMSREVQDFAW